MEETVETRLERLGIELPEAGKPAANYTNAVRVHNLLFLSGKGPAGKPEGKLGIEFSTAEGYRYARSAGIEMLAVLKQELGGLDKVQRVVKLQGFVNADAGYREHHLVLNGCSDLMRDVFGERGVHSRSVMGASSLRDNLPLVIDSIFECS